MADGQGEKQETFESGLVKATVYIRRDQVLAIEEIQLTERRLTGKRKDKSELMQEAIDLLIAKYRPSA